MCSKQIVITSATLYHRLDIPHFLNDNNLTGLAAEIGVWRGDYAFAFLDQWQGKCLYLVDPWRKLPDSEYDDVRNRDFNPDDYLHVQERATNYGECIKLLKHTSLEAAQIIEDSSLDFVYIDANHAYTHIKQDLAIWWNKLKLRSVLAGHDLFTIEHPAISQAIIEFALEEDVMIEVIDGDYRDGILVNNYSWLIRKGW